MRTAQDLNKHSRIDWALQDQISGRAYKQDPATGVLTSGGFDPRVLSILMQTMPMPEKLSQIAKILLVEYQKLEDSLFNAEAIAAMTTQVSDSVSAFKTLLAADVTGRNMLAEVKGLSLEEFQENWMMYIAPHLEMVDTSSHAEIPVDKKDIQKRADNAGFGDEDKKFLLNAYDHIVAPFREFAVPGSLQAAFKKAAKSQKKAALNLSVISHKDKATLTADLTQKINLILSKHAYSALQNLDYDDAVAKANAFLDTLTPGNMLLLGALAMRSPRVLLQALVDKDYTKLSREWEYAADTVKEPLRAVQPLLKLLPDLGAVATDMDKAFKSTAAKAARRPMVLSFERR